MVTVTRKNRLPRDNYLLFIKSTPLKWKSSRSLAFIGLLMSIQSKFRKRERPCNVLEDYDFERFIVRCKTSLFFALTFEKVCCIGTSYPPKFQKRAVTNLKNYSTKNDEKLRKPKKAQ